jgi:hypothetical protein
VTHIYIKSSSNQRSTTSREASAAGRLRPNALMLTEPINSETIVSEVVWSAAGETPSTVRLARKGVLGDHLQCRLIPSNGFRSHCNRPNNPSAEKLKVKRKNGSPG